MNLLQLVREADLIVVGAGLYGLTIAEQAASEAGLRVLIIERRNHPGGNAWSEVDPDTGIEVHRYGSHLFHCSDDAIWAYITRFSEFNSYRHHVMITTQGRVYSLPINLGTICSFFGRSFPPNVARELICQQAGELAGKIPTNLEEQAISQVGRPLYEALIGGYTAKQWQTDPRELPAEIIRRLPVRFNFNTRYFDDTHEGLPAGGYAALIRAMLDHPRIALVTGVDFLDVKAELPFRKPLVYSGAIDRYFGFSEGRLQWRTLDFERLILETPDYQGCAVMNYGDRDVPYTRVHEFRHLHPERRYGDRTVIFREYSRWAGESDEPYYPVATGGDRAKFDRYRSRAAQESNVIFGGRLGSYQYLDMHQAIGAGLAAWHKQLAPLFRDRLCSGVTSVPSVVG